MSDILKPGTPVEWHVPMPFGLVVRAHIPDARAHAQQHGLPHNADPLAETDGQAVHYEVLCADGLVRHMVASNVTLMKSTEGERGTAVVEKLTPQLIALLTPDAAPSHAHQGPRGSVSAQEEATLRAELGNTATSAERRKHAQIALDEHEAAMARGTR